MSKKTTQKELEVIQSYAKLARHVSAMMNEGMRPDFSTCLDANPFMQEFSRHWLPTIMRNAADGGRMAVIVTNTPFGEPFVDELKAFFQRTPFRVGTVGPFEHRRGRRYGRVYGFELSW